MSTNLEHSINYAFSLYTRLPIILFFPTLASLPLVPLLLFPFDTGGSSGTSSPLGEGTGKNAGNASPPFPALPDALDDEAPALPDDLDEEAPALPPFPAFPDDFDLEDLDFAIFGPLDDFGLFLEGSGHSLGAKL